MNSQCLCGSVAKVKIRTQPVPPVACASQMLWLRSELHLELTTPSHVKAHSIFRHWPHRVAAVLLIFFTGSSLVSCGKGDPRIEIRESAKKGSLGKVKALLEGDPNLIHSRDTLGVSLLHLAAANGRKDVAELLLNNGLNANIPDNYRSTPLHMAATSGSREIVQLLLARGADARVTDNFGETPLHLAASNGHKDVAELLLAGNADVNVKDNNGWTPLHWAVGNNHKDVVELLLSNRAEVNAKENQGRTPLQLALSGNHADIADLLRKEGAQ